MTANDQSDRPISRREAILLTLGTALLLLLPALICLAENADGDPDVWWHLKTGEWIFLDHAVPAADPFSSYGAGKPWAAYSWLAELIIFGLYQGLGLRGLILFGAALSTAIVAAMHALLRRLQPNPLVAGGLTAVAVFGLVPVLTLRPWLFSILLLVVELDLLLTAGRTGNRRLLLWLVPLFCLWANVHIQFVLGLAVLGLAVAEPLLVRAFPISMASDDSRRISFGWMVLVFALCVAATLANPYHWRLYAVAAQLLGQSELWNAIREVHAMPFRTAANWIVLAVTVAATFAMGWRRRVRLLLLLLFLAAIYLSFRSQRDAWLVLLVGLAVLADVCPKAAVRPMAMPAWSRWAVAGLVSATVLVTVSWLGESRLEAKVAARFPTHAVEFIQEQQAAGPPFSSGPMFNSFGWGGYLIYHLPQIPVSIDGRTMVHGQDRVLRHAKTLRGEEGWQDDPELAEARLVVLPRKKVLASLLRLDPRFQLVYEDPVAVIFDQEGDSR